MGSWLLARGSAQSRCKCFSHSWPKTNLGFQDCSERHIYNQSGTLVFKVSLLAVLSAVRRVYFLLVPSISYNNRV